MLEKIETAWATWYGGRPLAASAPHASPSAGRPIGDRSLERVAEGRGDLMAADG
jgi:hypothetical protein